VGGARESAEPVLLVSVVPRGGRSVRRGADHRCVGLWSAGSACVFDDAVVGGAADLSGAQAGDRELGVGGDVVDVASCGGFEAVVGELAVPVADFDDAADGTVKLRRRDAAMLRLGGS